MTAAVPRIDGVEPIVAWFGHWPSFHDAEILSVHINRGGTSSVRILTFITTDRVDDKGRYIREREATVVFEFSGIRALNLAGEDADVQNVIAGLSLDTVDEGFQSSPHQFGQSAIDFRCRLRWGLTAGVRGNLSEASIGHHRALERRVG